MSGVCPRIVALGDSLTSGHGIGTAASFPAVLQQKIDREGFDYTVINAGVSRDTSAQALQRLDVALAGDVRILILAVGANDGLRGVPVEQVRQNLARIIETAQARRIAIVLCGMNPMARHCSLILERFVASGAIAWSSRILRPFTWAKPRARTCITRRSDHDPVTRSASATH